MTSDEDRKQTKYGHKRREHMTHTTEDWHYSPLPKGSSRALTVPSGRGGGRSGGPSGQTRTGTQDGDLQSGTDRQGPWRCRELRWPWQMVFGGLGLSPLGPAPTAGTPFTPPKKISLGKSGGIRSHTEQYRTALQGQTDRTGQPTGTGSPPGLARRLRLLLGMTRSQRPSQGPSATASTTRGQAARMASMATTRGAACPRRVSVDMTRQDLIKMFLWAQQNRHTALLAVTCGLSTGLG